MSDITINHILSDYKSLQKFCKDGSILQRVTWLMILKEMDISNFRQYQIENLILFISDMTEVEKIDYLKTLSDGKLVLHHPNMVCIMKAFKNEFEKIFK